MKFRLIPLVILLLIATGPVNAQISNAAVASSYEQLRKVGLEGYAGTLVDWLHDSGNPSDDAMIQASAALIWMMKEGVIFPEAMDELCAVAKDCKKYLGVGGGMSLEKAQEIINEGVWVANNGLPKMLEIARNATRGKQYGGSSQALVAKKLVDCKARKISVCEL